MLLQSTHLWLTDHFHPYQCVQIAWPTISCPRSKGQRAVAQNHSMMSFFEKKTLGINCILIVVCLSFPKNNSMTCKNAYPQWNPNSKIIWLMLEDAFFKRGVPQQFSPPDFPPILHEDRVYISLIWKGPWSLQFEEVICWLGTPR